MKNICCEMVKCSVLMFVLWQKTFSKVSCLRLASEGYLALSFFIFVFPYDCVTGLLQEHPLMPIIIIKALYIHLSDELLSNWLVDENYWISSLPFLNMSGTKWNRFDFSQYLTFYHLCRFISGFIYLFLKRFYFCSSTSDFLVTSIIWKLIITLTIKRYYS